MRFTLIVALTLCSVAPASGVIVRLKDRPEPVIGVLSRDEKERLVVRTTDAEGKAREEILRRSDIDEIVPPFSSDKLAALDPVNPAAYRDYAEELRARRRDPESRDMAMRLYLIAAWLDREKLGRSGLLGLVSLARSEQEERKFKAALFVVDPRTTVDVLQGSSATTASGGDAESAAPELLRALRLLRTGRGASARALLEKPALLKLLESYSRIMSKAEFNAAAGQATLNPRELRQVLVLELELEGLLHPGSAAERTASLAWSRELTGEGGKAVPSLSLETLTEFDPRKCVWREGKWQERK